MSLIKVTGKQLIAINERGLSFDDRSVTWNKYDGDLVAVMIEDDCVFLWIFREDGNVFHEYREFGNEGWITEGWRDED